MRHTMETLLQVWVSRQTVVTANCACSIMITCLKDAYESQDLEPCSLCPSHDTVIQPPTLHDR